MSHAADAEVEVLHPSRRRWILLLALSLGFVAIGVVILPTHPTLAWFEIGFFGLCAALGATNLLPGASHLRLDAEGFEVRTLFRARRFAWRDIAEFGATQVGLNRMVGWNFAAGHVGNARLRQVNAQLSGFEAALPDTYGCNVEALAARMTARRARALSRQGDLTARAVETAGA